MAKEFKISNLHLYIAIGLVSANELYSLYSFNKTSKSHDVEGTVQGLFGFYKDLSDAQWREFESNLGLIALFQLLFLTGSYLIKYASPLKDRYRNLQIYNIIIGMTYSFFMHNLGMIFQFGIVCFFYLYQKIFINYRYFSSVLWTLAVFILYMNETYQGYKFADFFESLQILDDIRTQYELERWSVMFNLILLKIISFAIDHYWAQKNKPIKKTELSFENKITYKDVVEEHQPLNEYNFIGYLSYCYYAPLFIAGPTTTFNAFNAQLKVPQQTYNRAQVIKYVLRVYLIDLLTFEFFLYWCYPSAIPKVKANSHILATMTMYQLHEMGFMNLLFLWYKFLTIWRITRAWALMDGIEVPENMNRCIYNNYNFQGFWRSWHRSFNQWLIRYIYVPLGGSKYKVINMWIVFTFVAIWHDFNLDLILWAWIICLALIPEILVMSYFHKEHYYKQWWFKYATLFACGIQVELMCLSNIIGFGSGHEGMKMIINKFLSFAGLFWVIFIIVIKLASTTAISFKVRANEKRDRIEKNF